MRTNIFSEIRRTPSHGRLLSCNQRSLNKEKMSLVDDFISSCEDEMSVKGEIQSPYSENNTSINFSHASIYGRSGKMTMYPVLQKEVSQDVLQEQPSVLIEKQDPFPSIFKEYMNNQDTIIMPNDMQKSNELLSRVTACKEKVLSMVKQESVMKEKLDENEEDDANIPEEDHEVELELQKPQLRIIKKIPSQPSFFDNSDEKESTEQMIAKIVDEVYQQTRKAEKYNQMSINQELAYQSIPTVEFLNMVPSPQYRGTVLLQEQGNYGSDLSQIYQVQDESVIINVPQDEKQNLKMTVGMAHQQQKNNKIAEEFIESVAFETLYLYCSRRQAQNAITLLADWLQSKKPNAYFIDFVYIIGHICDLDRVKIMMKQNCFDITEMSFSTKLSDFYMFELINHHQTKIYDKQSQLKLQIKQLEGQKLSNNNSVAILSESQSKISLVDAPRLKLKKNASVHEQHFRKQTEESKSIASLFRNSQVELQSSSSHQKSQQVTTPVLNVKTLLNSKKLMENSEKIQPKLLSQHPLDFKQNVMTITPVIKKANIAELSSTSVHALDSQRSKLKIIKLKEGFASPEINPHLMQKHSKFLQSIEKSQKKFPQNPLKPNGPKSQSKQTPLAEGSRKRQGSVTSKSSHQTKTKSEHKYGSMKAGKQSRNVSHKVSLTENSETTQIKIFDEELSDSSKTPVEEKLRVVAPSLKANHLHKMNVVQQNAVKKKSMFTHSVPYDSNRSTKKASLDSFYHSNSLKNLNLTERRNEKPAQVYYNNFRISSAQSPKQSIDFMSFQKRGSVKSEKLQKEELQESPYIPNMK